MASRTPKNDEQLAQGAPHLVYEVQMLGALTEYIKTKAIDARVRDMPQDGLPARNAILESFAVHARVLLGFLYPDDGLIKDADVLARDYFGSGAWKPSAKTKALETVRGRVGTEVAHLSYKRNHHSVSEDVRNWDVGRIRHDLVERLREFASSADRLADSDRARLEQALSGQKCVPDPTPATPSVVSSATSGMFGGGTATAPFKPPGPT